MRNRKNPAAKTVMVQIRNVPERTHRRLKARAAAEGRSLSDYLLHEIERIAELPSLQEFCERLRQHEPVNPPISAAQIIREQRDSR